MAHMDPLDPALTDGVGDTVKRVADDPVAPLYAGCLQCFDQYVGDSLAHPEPPVPLVNVAAKILAKPNLTIGDAAIHCASVVPDIVIVWLR
jgi:hypothetical protein